MGTTYTALDAYGHTVTVNTLPSQGQATSPNSLPTVPSSTGILSFSGTRVDMSNYSSVIINCMVAPLTPWTVEYDDGVNTAVPALATFYPSSGGAVSQGTTVNAIGRYVLAGNGGISMTGGTGGTFSIVGTN